MQMRNVAESKHNKARFDADKGNVASNVISSINSLKHVEGGVLGEFMNMDNNHGDSVYPDIIYKLTRMHVSPAKAKKCWNDIISHYQKLCKVLDRNVGIHVAVSDYFSNIKSMLKHPVLIEEGELVHREESAYRDGLTGLFNRRYFNQEMPREVERFRRFGIPFSLLMLDLDHFKRFNDKYGHQAGDTALRVVADVILQSARVYDKAVRYGGEEFAVILPQACRTEASVAAERIRVSVEEQSILHEGRNLGSITVSVGIATFPIDALEVIGLVRRADQALYVAKRRRNAVVAYCDYNRRMPRHPPEHSLPV